MGVNCSLRIGYGRSLVGSPAKKIVRSIRSKNYSICAGISKNGILHFKTQNSAYNKTTFCDFLKEIFEKMNLMNFRNYAIIMDNVAFHKSTEVRTIIEESGHSLLFLPPYSPQLNPIEEFFSKWKQHRKICKLKHRI